MSYGSQFGNNLVRLVGGRLWVAYATSDGRYIKARYSDDSGATWSAAETVFDAGSGGAVIRSCGMSFNVSGRLVCIVSGTAANQMNVYERSTPTSTGSWTSVITVGSQYSSNSQEHFYMLGSPLTDVFFLIQPASSGGGNSGTNRIAVTRYVPGSPWVGTAITGSPFALSNYSNGGGQFACYATRRVNPIIDAAGDIHFAAAGGRNSGSSVYTMFYGKISTPSGSPSYSVEEAYVSAGTTDAYAMIGVSIVLNSSGAPYIYWTWRAGSGSAINQAWGINKSSGSWSTAGRIPESDTTADGDYCIEANVVGGVPYIHYISPRRDGNTKFNHEHGTVTGAARTAWTNQNTYDDNAGGGGLYHAAFKCTQYDTGFAYIATKSTNTANLLFRIATDIDWDEGTAIYNQTISQTIRFNQQLSTQGFVIREVTSAAVNFIPGGGRQIVKTAAGVIWHVYYSGGSIKTSYSSDNGTTWTVVAVGPTWVPFGACMAIGAGDAPVLVLTRASNDDFYIYQWNGSTWVLKKQLNSPLAESESMQIVYTGSIYMLVSGFINTSSDRRVFSWTSSNLTTWTSLLIKDGDTAGTGPQRYRRVAACTDTNGYVHAVYSIRSGGTHKLYYRKYTGSWGTEELIHTASSGNNITDFHTGLSIAIDDLGQVHVACRVRGTIYTGRVRLAYFKRTTVWAAVEYVHDDVDADQGYPSLSLNLRTAIICFASSGLGLGVVHARRGSDGTWAKTTITSNTRDNIQTVHGPGYGSSLNYTRGVVGSMRGSEEYFYSTDIISGNAAAMENTINFTSILSTQQRVMSNGITFTSLLSAIRGIGLRSTIHFTQQLNFARTKVLTPGVIHFTQHLEGTIHTPITQTIHFTHELQGNKDPVKALSHTIHFTSSLNRVLEADMENTITFSGVLSTSVVKNLTITQTINFGSVLGLNFTLRKPLTGIINFIVGLVAMKADEGCEPAFTPERPIADPNDLDFVYLIGPLPDLQLTVQLKKPEYGNARRQSLQVKVNRTRGGKLRPHARTPTYEPQPLTWNELSYLKLEEVRNFLRVCKGKKIYYIDERGRKWVGYSTSSDIDLADEAFEKGGTFQMDFEGVLTV